MSKMEFSFQVPTRIEFRAGCSGDVGKELKNFSSQKALVVTDKGVAESGLLDKVLAVIKSESIGFKVFDEVVGNPTSEIVHRGVDAFKADEFDSIVAVGGGSPIDSAKAIGIAAKNGIPVEDYSVTDNNKQPEVAPPPLIAIPTTAGTSSEVNQWSVITDTKRKFKMSLGGPLWAPKVALCDAEMTLTLPPELTATTGLDALTHAIEGLCAKNSNTWSDMYNLQAIKLIFSGLREAVANGEDITARKKMLLGSISTGIGYAALSGLGNVHAMAHTLGGYYDVPHGIANAILLPYVMEFNLMAVAPKFALMAKEIGENVDGMSTIEAGEKAIKSVKRLSADLKMPSLKEVGMQEADINELAALAIGDINATNNPRATTLEDMIAIFKEAY